MTGRRQNFPFFGAKAFRHFCTECASLLPRFEMRSVSFHSFSRIGFQQPPRFFFEVIGRVAAIDEEMAFHLRNDVNRVQLFRPGLIRISIRVLLFSAGRCEIEGTQRGHKSRTEATGRKLRGMLQLRGNSFPFVSFQHRSILCIIMLSAFLPILESQTRPGPGKVSRRGARARPAAELLLHYFLSAGSPLAPLFAGRAV